MVTFQSRHYCTDCLYLCAMSGKFLKAPGAPCLGSSKVVVVNEVNIEMPLENGRIGLYCLIVM